MTVFNISGATLTLTGNGAVNGGNIALANTINPVTGGMGIDTVRVVNTSAANIATFTYTPSDVTYTFSNLAGTPSGGGANARFNVTVANTSGYQVAIANAGSGYANAETITILGTSLGGATTANDLTLTLTVGTAGAITSVAAAGTRVWPQSNTATLSILPSTEEFIQVTANASIGAYFSANIADGNLLVTPVTIVG
jgi:hypothetical protein